MKKLFVVSDVHSFYYELRNALDDKGWDQENNSHVLVCCGDLFDRGAYPSELFEFVKDLYEKDRFIYIRGNHEDLLQDCLNEIINDELISLHHIRNKTLETIALLSQQAEEELICNIPSAQSYAIKTMLPIMEWIDKVSLDYLETDKYVFVHGWIPQDMNSPDEWVQARWLNGMEEWKKGNRISGKTIVCGHWHCSWGWSHIRQERKEWPQLNRKDWIKSFEPFVDDGIMAIDACTAYSGIVNCIVIEE